VWVVMKTVHVYGEGLATQEHCFAYICTVVGFGASQRLCRGQRAHVVSLAGCHDLFEHGSGYKHTTDARVSFALPMTQVNKSLTLRCRPSRRHRFGRAKGYDDDADCAGASGRSGS
jgi:hypothetical protein